MKISKEFKVGVFMVAGISILYLGFNYLKGQEFFSSNDKYYAIYANIDGLNVSNPIMINGFTVGRVSRITLLQNDNDKVLVELDIRGEIVVGDSTVAVLNSDFLGNKSISLRGGNVAVPLQSGDTLIAQLDKGIADILAESAQPVANNLEATIKKINAILDNLQGNGERVNQLMEELAKSPKILNASIYELRKSAIDMMTTYDQVGKELNTTLKSTKPAIRNFTAFSDSLKQMELQTTVERANKALSDLSSAIEHFSKNEGTLGKLINDDSLYVNLNDAVQSLDRLLIHIDTNPKHFFSPLGKSKEKIEKERRKEAKRGN
ncbi:MlaD family protein [Fulvivirga lutea]|uniref:MCE family protein n=1 Tax=Fulvivirga lutea TaxID=2810512 RepID=A0A974WLR9_9BACT|nr:MlaD family protein [Fulvivirga lutea]QSE97743.1 MCE family protein [Fulvivirga lutea]